MAKQTNVKRYRNKQANKQNLTHIESGVGAESLAHLLYRNNILGTRWKLMKTFYKEVLVVLQKEAGLSASASVSSSHGGKSRTRETLPEQRSQRFWRFVDGWPWT